MPAATPAERSGQLRGKLEKAQWRTNRPTGVVVCSRVFTGAPCRRGGRVEVASRGDRVAPVVPPECDLHGVARGVAADEAPYLRTVSSLPRSPQQVRARPVVVHELPTPQRCCEAAVAPSARPGRALDDVERVRLRRPRRRTVGAVLPSGRAEHRPGAWPTVGQVGRRGDEEAVVLVQAHVARVARLEVGR